MKRIHIHTGWVYSFTAHHLKGMLAAADDVVRVVYKTSTQDLSVSSEGGVNLSDYIGAVGGGGVGLIAPCPAGAFS